MITLKDFMEVTNYRITEGNTYGWNCFGPNAYCLDSWNNDLNGHTISIVFDTVTQEVFQATAYDYTSDRAYRITNPRYKELYFAECANRNITDCAWEDDDGVPVKYVDLEVVEDFIEKATAIVEGEDYDTRVQIPLNLEKDMLHELMLVAHQNDMTLNELVEGIIREEVERLENDGR